MELEDKERFIKIIKEMSTLGFSEPGGSFHTLTFNIAELKILKNVNYIINNYISGLKLGHSAYTYLYTYEISEELHLLGNKINKLQKNYILIGGKK